MKTLHIVSHTHWDREWYLTFQQFRLKLVQLVDSLLDLLERDRDFRFFMLDGQTIVVDDYLQIRPEKRKLIRKYVRKGRIQIGPWHILPDMFLVGPEAHIRNLLQGDRTARKFGNKMMVGYIPDPFGHPGQVPQILRGFKIDTACIWRGVADQPAEFWWESPDGSRVLMAFMRDSYSNGAGLAVSQAELFTEQLAAAQASLAAASAVQEHLVMLGTDHMEPSPDTAAAINYADTHMSDTHVVHSTLPIFIKDVRKQIAGLILPVHSGELRACKRSPLLPGVLSTRIWIKQRNHASEILLVKWAEPFSTFASHLIKDQRNIKGESPSPIQLEPASLIRDTADILRHAWRILMENHPHDSICGCSIDQVHDEMRPRFDQVDQIGGEITRQSLQTIADRVNTHFEAAVIPSEDLHGDVSAVVVFNPGGMTYAGPVDVSVDLPNGASDIEIFDSTGEVLPHKSDSVEQRELINMILDRKGMREGLSMVHGGLIAGMMVQEITLEKAGERVTFRMVLSETGAPNMEAWAEGMDQGRAYLEDPEIKSFHVLAHSVLSPQVRFIATEVPPHGWNTFWVRAMETQEEKPAEVHPLVKPLLPVAIRLAGTRLGGWATKVFSPKGGEVPPFVIINEFFRVEANEDDGALTIQDLRTGLVYQGQNRFVDSGDAGDEYNYSPPLADSTITAEVDSVRVYHHPVEEILEISYRMDVPAGLAPDRKGRTKETVSLPIRSNVRLYPGVARIDITTEVDNLAKDHRLRVHFPAPFPADQADYDGHFEVVRRPIGIPQRGDDWVEDPRPEMPQRAFVDISDGEAGLMVANRGLPEVEIMQNADGLGEIALTLLRCVEWLSRDDLRTRDGHAGPGLHTPGAQMPGKSRFEYSIIPHSGYWDAAHSLALNFQTPFRAVNTRIHDGVIPPKGSFLNVSQGAFAISAVKKTEDGRGILVRGYNQTSVPIDVRLDLWVPFRKAELVNLAEERLRKLKPARDGTVSFPVSGNQIVSVVFRS